MSTPFMAEMRLISFNFAPKGWALCNGQFMQINQNQALFSLLGTTYGGDGRLTFALPDVRGRVPIGQGSQFSVLGERGGEEFHTLIQTEMPAHMHVANGNTNDANSGNPTADFIAKIPTQAYTTSIGSLTSLAPAAISSTGGSQPHENRQPFLVLNMMIALQGVFPSRN
jgi:microcystin-dependent protein